jgi:hypothetical protein
MMFGAGILLAALGAGLVLYSKGSIEIKKGPPVESRELRVESPE